MIVKTLFYLLIGLFLVYLNYSWWLIGFVFGIETMLSTWDRWRRIRPLTPEQSLGGLTALIRIRGVEIGAIYRSLHYYQRKSDSDSWIALFIAEYRKSSRYNIYDEPSDRQEKKYLQQANALYKKRFERGYDHFFGVLNDEELADIGVAMLYWTTSITTTIRLLNSVHCDRNLTKHVCALLKDYRLIRLLTLNGNYHILFKNLPFISALVRERYSLLCAHWEEVLRFHQCSILITQASHDLQQMPPVLEDTWKENQFLTDMEGGLRAALSRKNSKRIGQIGNNEELFFQHLKSNPMWTKLGYESPFP